MDAALLEKYGGPVPRYTSYPTAPHFTAAVDADTYTEWLGDLPATAPLSVYVHIPFCDSLCWFCGCHMRVVRRHSTIRSYLDLLHGEATLVAEAAGPRRTVRHLHIGGGSPDILEPPDVESLVALLNCQFRFAADMEFAVEFDPRALERPSIAAWAAAGANRASIGVQDFDRRVQEAINREQTFACTAEAVAALRSAGIAAVNIDLMYGLPHQTVEGIRCTAMQVLKLAPDRVALFGYAHVPWMKPHQTLIPESALPDGVQRWAQFEAAAELLREAGYVSIGFDHFALPKDPLALAAADGRLRRNFQGYTIDASDALIGLGASAIGALPQGYVQNLGGFDGYRKAVRAGRLPVARGVALNGDDRERRRIIERLLCDARVDVAAMTDRRDKSGFAAEFNRLAEMEQDGIVEVHGSRISVTDRGRPFLRAVGAVFDRYLQDGVGRHSRAV